MSEPVMMLNSIGVREIAEYAASVRGVGGDPRYFVATLDEAVGGYHVRCEQEHQIAPSPDDVVVPCSTALVQPARPRVENVSIQAQGMLDPESLRQYDAVFWSEAAVEKFLFPYYASKYQWAAAHVLTVLSQVFYGYVPEPTLGAHPGETGTTVNVETTEVPIAVAHLPRSDYTAVEEPATLGSDTAFLFMDITTGKVRHRLLSEFLQPAREELPGAGEDRAPRTA